MSTEYRPFKFKCQETLKNFTKGYWDRVYQARESGKKIVYCSGLAPVEIATAMDFIPVFTMNNSAVCGIAKVSTELCQRAEIEGFSPDICSYPRTDIGSALAGEETLNPLKPPKPDLLLVGNGQCHTITKWLESLGWAFDVPVFLLDAPSIHDDTEEETKLRAVKYVKDQLQELILYLEDFTGRSFDYDRLQEHVEFSGRMARLFREVLEMRENIPSPMSAFDIFTNLFPFLGLRATPEAPAYYQELKEEVAERVKNKVGTIPNERFRLHLDGVPMWFNLRGLAAKFASYDACPITHVYPFIFGVLDKLDSSRPLDSIAESSLLAPINQGIKQRVEVYVNLIKKYHLDGLAMQMSRTCKALCTGVYTICEEVEKRTGVPSLIYETDMCDSRLYSEANVDVRLQAFMEMLESKISR